MTILRNENIRKILKRQNIEKKRSWVLRGKNIKKRNIEKKNIENKKY